MNLATVKRYASGKAPFLGVPYLSLVEGRYRTAVFHKQHLQAACDAPVTKAHYDEENHLLVLNGSKRAEWRLIDQRFKGLQDWQIKQSQENWAGSQRKRKVTLTTTTREQRTIVRQVEQLETEIRKLTRAKNKMYFYETPPLHPLLLSRTYGWPKQLNQEDWTAWRAEKDIRVRLVKLARSPRKTWAQFYRDVAEITGRDVDTGYRHDRVCNRKGGPGIVSYLNEIYRHIHLARKPFQRGEPWKPYEKLGYGEEHDQNEFQRHRTAQVEWLRRKRERESILNQIEQHTQKIAELKAALEAGQ